jgi:hypothetical protein
MSDIDTLLPLIELVHGTGTYQDRLRSTNVSEFTIDDTLQSKEKEFVRDTTLDPK